MVNESVLPFTGSLISTEAMLRNTFSGAHALHCGTYEQTQTFCIQHTFMVGVRTISKIMAKRIRPVTFEFSVLVK